MRLVIDADACPSIEAVVNIAKKYNIECHIFCDYNHNINIEGIINHQISQGFQTVDMAICNFIKKGDILITQDYGLACIALSLKSSVINQNGIIYTNDNIDNLLEQRYLNTLNRKRKIKTKNSKKRTKDIDRLFLNNLKYLIDFTKNS